MFIQVTFANGRIDVETAYEDLKGAIDKMLVRNSMEKNTRGFIFTIFNESYDKMYEFKFEEDSDLPKTWASRFYSLSMSEFFEVENTLRGYFCGSEASSN